MKSILWLGTLLALGAVAPSSPAFCLGTRGELDRVNRRIQGRVLDFTKNHGADNRIWSPVLQQWRDLYVYLPPGYDPHQCYPVILYFHGFSQDELFFLRRQIQMFDEAIVSGCLPPAIIAVPDGSLKGRATFKSTGSFFVNSNAGNYEDFVIQDVWGFLTHNFPIRPEREAHVLTGASMGGFAAYHLGIKYRQCFGVVAALFPPLNLRWVDCHGRYRANFDPCCWGWRTELRPHEVVGRFFGVITIKMKNLTDPLFGRGPEVIDQISRVNPIEMLDSYCLHEGELAMYIAYAGCDQFNLDAQVESFLYRAKQKGLTVDVAYDPKGRHNFRTGVRLFPGFVAWLGPRLAPYSPPLATAGVPCPAP